jgi:hypothetical protein
MKKSKRKRMQRNCSKKTKHASYKNAEIELKRLEKQKGFKYIIVYKCTICKYFHIGHRYKILKTVDSYCHQRNN